MFKNKVFLRGPYQPVHAHNRMKSEGDVEQARQNFIAQRFRNLDFLLRTRFHWMNAHIREGWRVLEVGAGAGFSEFYLKQKPFMTDIVSHEWIDGVLDAHKMDLDSASIDCIIASHNIHHFASPSRFFRECARVLRPGGVLLIQEINTSLVSRVLLRLMRHEGWSYEVDVFDENTPANDPSDPWSANCAIPELLFEDRERIERAFPTLRIELDKKCEFLIFPLSGGVISKTRIPELPLWLLRGVHAFDRLITMVAPNIFAMGRSVVIRKVG